MSVYKETARMVLHRGAIVVFVVFVDDFTKGNITIFNLLFTKMQNIFKLINALLTSCIVGMTTFCLAMSVPIPQKSLFLESDLLCMFY